MTLFAWELRVAVDFSVEVAGHNVLDAASSDDVLWVAVGQLNPVAEQIIRHPVDEMIDT